MSKTLTPKKLKPSEQLEVLSQRQTGAAAFSEKMIQSNLFPLKPTSLEIVQINV